MSDILLFLAVLPVIALCYFIYKKDQNKEPMGLLMKIFWLGFFSAIPVVIVELILGAFFPTDGEFSFIITFFNVFISVALVEEGFKWLVTKFTGFDNKEFDEIYDVIVYSVFASLGFACIENIIYVYSNGVTVAITRALLSIPGHMCFGVIMGYFLSRAKVAKINGNSELCTRNLILSLLCPSLVHAMYDALIFYGSDLSILSFFLFDIAMVVVCFITVSKVSKIQRNVTTNINTGVIVNDGFGHIHLGNSGGSNYNFCPVCGKASDGSNFCGRCGMRLIK